MWPGQCDKEEIAKGTVEFLKWVLDSYESAGDVFLDAVTHYLEEDPMLSAIMVAVLAMLLELEEFKGKGYAGPDLLGVGLISIWFYERYKEYGIISQLEEK